MSRRRAPGKLDRRTQRSRHGRAAGGDDGGWAAAATGSDPILGRVAASHAMGRWFAAQRRGRQVRGRPLWPLFLLAVIVLLFLLAILG